MELIEMEKKLVFQMELEKNDDFFFDYTCNTFPRYSGGYIANQSNNFINI